MDHKILLAKLEHYGVRGEALRFLVIYLRGRFQYMVYNKGELGRWVVECRVPPGSVLGTLFLFIYETTWLGF